MVEIRLIDVPERRVSPRPGRLGLAVGADFHGGGKRLFPRARGVAQVRRHGQFRAGGNPFQGQVQREVLLPGRGLDFQAVDMAIRWQGAQQNIPDDPLGGEAGAAFGNLLGGGPHVVDDLRVDQLGLHQHCQARRLTGGDEICDVQLAAGPFELPCPLAVHIDQGVGGDTFAVEDDPPTRPFGGDADLEPILASDTIIVVLSGEFTVVDGAHLNERDVLFLNQAASVTGSGVIAHIIITATPPSTANSLSSRDA